MSSYSRFSINSRPSKTQTQGPFSYVPDSVRNENALLSEQSMRNKNAPIFPEMTNNRNVEVFPTFPTFPKITSNRNTETFPKITSNRNTETFPKITSNRNTKTFPKITSNRNTETFSQPINNENISSDFIEPYEEINLTLEQMINVENGLCNTDEKSKRETCVSNSVSVKQSIIWVNLEMTGLNIEKDQIMEMACLITDGQLNIIADAPNLVIHTSDQVLNSMGEWCQINHGKSGLTEECRNSRISLNEAEEIMVDFVQKHTLKGQSPLAGNSVYYDKMFLQKYMPTFANWLHYQIIDVTSVTQLCLMWYPETKFPESSDNINDSVELLKFLRKNFFRN